MATDTTGDKLTEQGLLDAMNECINKLNQACAAFEDTKILLTTHQSDGAAHPDIRDLIQDVVEGTGFLLKTEASTLIQQLIHSHDTSNEAHELIRTTIATLSNTVDTLKARLDVLDPQDPTDPQTELARRLAAIDAQYDPILNNLREAYLSAVMLNTGLASEIANEYSATAALKAAAISAVMQEFQYA